MNESKVQEVATGQFFTGRKAYELGLVDELGTIKEAKEYIKQVEKLEKIDLAHYKKPKSFLEAMLSAMSDASFNIGHGIGDSLKEEGEFGARV